RFKDFRSAGVTRISMGVQALNDEDLRRLGRLHSTAEAKRAFEIARSTFDRVSFDLIYARQGQSVTDWERELREALAMAVDHLSLYQLTIEPGTAFGDRFARGRLRELPDEETSADMFAVTQEITATAGMPAYEVSNHAAPGAESRHNRLYWRYGDWAGIGPGAHGRLTRDGRRQAIESVRAPQNWLAAVENDGAGESGRDTLTAQEEADEYLLMSLRLTEGMDIRRHRQLGGHLPQASLQHLQELSLVESDGNHVRTTTTGRMVLNAVIRELGTAE
ncbi:MAG: coproporphyrinogen-III oxidase family protein, partial [Paracoccaceae bacterium]